MSAYVVAEVEIENPEGYKAYTAVVAATVEKYGGKFLVRGMEAQVLEGDWPVLRRVIIEFPSKARALEWWNSPEYKEPMALRRANSKGRLILLDGV